MDENFFGYLSRLEMLAFFSGYPLVYFVILALAGKETARTPMKRRLVSLLPLSYALTGTLFLGLLIRNLYPDYSMAHVKESFRLPLLTAWALCSIFFWLPFFRNKPVISILHSGVFFFLIAKDFYLQLTSSNPDKNILKNDMKVYTDSLLLNSVTYTVVIIFFLIIARIRK
jgi:hypothetical protein